MREVPSVWVDDTRPCLLQPLYRPRAESITASTSTLQQAKVTIPGEVCSPCVEVLKFDRFLQCTGHYQGRANARLLQSRSALDR